jgi:hypothetical protein
MSAQVSKHAKYVHIVSVDGETIGLAGTAKRGVEWLAVYAAQGGGKLDAKTQRSMVKEIEADACTARSLELAGSEMVLGVSKLVFNVYGVTPPMAIPTAVVEEPEEEPETAEEAEEEPAAEEEEDASAEAAEEQPEAEEEGPTDAEIEAAEREIAELVAAMDAEDGF